MGTGPGGRKPVGSQEFCLWRCHSLNLTVSISPSLRLYYSTVCSFSSRSLQVSFILSSPGWLICWSIASTPFFFLFNIFWCGPFLKALLNLLQYCSVLFFWWWGMWNLNSLARGQTYTPWTGRQQFSHWITSKLPLLLISEAFFDTNSDFNST